MSKKRWSRPSTREKLCSFHGCKNLTIGSRFCQVHGQQSNYHTSPAAKASKAFLNSAAWLKLRALKLSMVPWCEQCDREGRSSVPAEDVDHVLPRHQRPDLRLTLSNLQSLCKECHGKKTRAGL